MIKPNDHRWTKVKNYINRANAIAFDDCHKIYILMNIEQTEQMYNYGYEDIFKINDNNKEQAYALLREWYYGACSLRFVEAVEDINENKFETLIEQDFETDDDAINEFYEITPIN